MRLARLYAALQSTLRGAIARADGLSASELKKEKKWGMQVHGRTGLACPVCADTIRQVIFTDSTFQYCPTCQTGGETPRRSGSLAVAQVVRARATCRVRARSMSGRPSGAFRAYGRPEVSAVARIQRGLPR